MRKVSKVLILTEVFYPLHPSYSLSPTVNSQQSTDNSQQSTVNSQQSTDNYCDRLHKATETLKN
ncbi:MULTISPECIES: hypothetical protein [unclassified Microcoleus]|uniref:hypothetical protein n=1 Tax=unclassified Microcoleus TaxID=2642155 RepID=UPI002FD70D16